MWPKLLSGLGLAIVPQAPSRVELGVPALPLLPAERIRCGVIADTLVARVMGLDYDDMVRILQDVDHAQARGAATGFWRVDKNKDPELRRTVLALVALRHLEASVGAVESPQDAGIQPFLSENHGEGWLLPETVRLSDHGLGHDDRARVHQPVASVFGPRFYDWQLAQASEESWRECHLHARNLLGTAEYTRLIGRDPEDDEIDSDDSTPTATGAPRWTPDDGSALRAAEPTREYTPEAPVAPPQTEILRRPQADLFE